MSTLSAIAHPEHGVFVGGGTERLILISPCRDEAAYMRRTLDSVAAQTRPPDLWIVVDDGSTDATPEILAEYQTRLPYLRVVHRKDRGERKVGPGVIDAFYEGLAHADLAGFAHLCKLDLDLDLPPRYFELLLDRMRENPRIGTCSGKAYYPHPKTGRLVSEACGDEMSVGMTKLYRTDCFTEIGGFVRAVMWDGIDCHRCRMFGWIAESYDDPELRFTHLRPMGSSHKGIWTGRKRHGAGQYYMGTGLAYMCASAAFRMTRPPYVVGGLGMLWGYLDAMLRGRPRYHDAAFREHLRRYQSLALRIGKARAAAEVSVLLAPARHRGPAQPTGDKFGVSASAMS